MWKEIIDIEDFNEIAILRNDFGCVRNTTGLAYMHNIQNKIDCHYYYYKSNKIELIKGYKQTDNVIVSIAFTIKADVKDYPEAIRLMVKHTIEYIKERNIKTYILSFGSKNESQVNFYNVGVGKIGMGEIVKIGKTIYEEFGFKLTYADNQIICELV